MLDTRQRAELALLGVALAWGLTFPLIKVAMEAISPGWFVFLRFALAAGPVTLDPRYATDATSTRINRLLYARLVAFDQQLRPVPAMAQWEQVSPTLYRFTLRADRAAFADGSPPVARDVEATYRSVLDPATGSPHRGSFDMIEAVEAVDETSVEFRLSRPDPLLPGRGYVGADGHHASPPRGASRTGQFTRLMAFTGPSDRPFGSGWLARQIARPKFQDWASRMPLLNRLAPRGGLAW